MSSPAPLPAAIGRYRVVGLLGQGAMAVVYRAHDPMLDRAVAIKLIRADLLDGAERGDYIARFRHEAQAAGRCTHPNIVTIYDFALHDGNPFLAMEYVRGVTLAATMRRVGRFAARPAIVVMSQVLDALGAAHAHGIVHRDVKPANILMLPDGRVKMADFGIARIDNTAMTQTGIMVGTPSYMSPEQCRAEPVDGRSDLFSAGTVLFELLSGERPFPGRTFTAIVQALIDPAPVALGERLAGQPPALVAVLRRALDKSVEKRFPSAEAMATALRAALPGLAGTTAAGSPAPDATVLAATGRGAPGTGDSLAGETAPADPAGIDPAILATIERRLADHIGPIARHLVREAARESGSFDALCARLGQSIERVQDREAFLDAVRHAAGMGSRPRPAAPGLPAAVLDRVQQELTRVLGPIARVLVTRAAAQAGSEAELRRQLATHIANAAERTAFLGPDA